MMIRTIAKKESAYTSNQELSLFFIRIINDYFKDNPYRKDLFEEIDRYLTSNSGIAALNLLSGVEVVSAAAMFRVLRLINDKELNHRFLNHPLTLGG